MRRRSFASKGTFAEGEPEEGYTDPMRNRGFTNSEIAKFLGISPDSSTITPAASCEKIGAAN